MELLKFKELDNVLTNSSTEKKIDEFGRIVIPFKFREENFKGENFYLNKVNDYIILSKDNENGEGIQSKFDELGRIKINMECDKNLIYKKNLL